MSTIYSAGQFDDAFSPKRLGNWEVCSKNAYHSLEPKQLYPSGPTQVIVDEKGHLLPGVPRNRATAWGLLQYYMKNRSVSNMATMSGQGKQRQPNSSVDKRMKKLPRYIPKKSRSPSQTEDLLLDYLKELRLPVVWIVGPATKRVFHKRKQFSKQLAASLRFGYVNLDEKIQEWKDRQSTCTCSATQLKSKPGSSTSITCIAPSKLPTNVPPHLAASLPSPRPDSVGPVISELLDSQRISFDAALPIERNKILELYKFALAECLPCDGFVCDSVPFDLVEGLAFEKTFYPAALAIYFAEGAPNKKLMKPKDRRLTSTIPEPCILGSTEYLERLKHPKGMRQAYLRTKSHKRLGNFSIMEAEKICRQFGSKTIRIINAEEVERDTMEFLNELVKKNLLKYQQILSGDATLDCSVAGCGRQYFRLSSTSTLTAAGMSASRASTHYSYASSFMPEGLEEDEEEANLRRCNNETVCLVPAVAPGTVELSNLPPAQTTATGKSRCQTSLSMFAFPNIFRTPPISQPRQRSVPFPSSSIVRHERYVKESDEASRFLDESGGGAGDFISANPDANDNSNSPGRKQSSELLEKINKLENKVAELNPEDGNSLPNTGLQDIEDSVDQEGQYIPPPTAYAVEDEVETLTSVIRRAIEQQNISPGAYQQHNYPERDDQNRNYDIGASGDSTNVNPIQAAQSQRQEGKPRKEEEPDPSNDMSYFEEQFSLLETDLKRKQDEHRRERSRHDEADENQDPNADPFFDSN